MVGSAPDTRVYLEAGNMEGQQPAQTMFGEQPQTRIGELDGDLRTAAELEEDDDRELMA